MEIHTIKTEEEYYQIALKQIDGLLYSSVNSREVEQLEILSILVRL